MGYEPFEGFWRAKTPAKKRRVVLLGAKQGRPAERRPLANYSCTYSVA